jgi:acyl-CoA thioester hydrolase
MDGKRVRTAFRVRYSETDRMGVAYYAEYLVWFEVMRGDFMRAVGIPYRDLEAGGLYLPISEARVRYRQPARYDDAIEVEAAIEGLKSRSITFTYKVERDGQLLATGSTTHIPLGADGHPRRFPRELLDRLSVYDLTGGA